MTITIFTNGQIYTMDQMFPLVQSVVVTNGRIIDMGTTSDMLLQWGRHDVKVIDLQERTVIPGLIESHVHIAGVAMNFLNLDVTGVQSKKELLEKIKERANSLQPGEWLLGRGWDENLFIDSSIPLIEELDLVAPHCPIYIPRICGHAFLVNSKALEICHVHPNTTVPEGGTIVLDERTGKPTGLLLESASELINKYIPEKSYSELKKAVRQAIKFAMEKGLTSVHTNDPAFLNGFFQTYQIYDELINEEQLGLRCNLLIDYMYMKELSETGMYAGFGNDHLQIGAIKIFADGALGRRTALLSSPYHDDPSTVGDAMFDQETLYSIIQEARMLAMPIAVHTIGDQALENVLDILDQFPAVAYRDRIIHAQVLRKELIPRLKKPSRIVDIQPRFVVGDFPWVQDRLGESRMQLSYAWKTLLSSGVICAGGSDAPVEPIDPLLGIHAAVTRRAPGETHSGWNPTEKLSIDEAIKLFTIGGSYATNEENSKGTITRGKFADMTVLSKNIFEFKNPDEILSTEVVQTVIGGKVTYEKAGATY
ncbi:amidohydrolase [Heyndrickxia oleronia]|uniref:amidohydrolase n=1 Tax=Heyndrickxia oleronia TaxID=38875 RepID=UPI001C0EC155|nr:amidohydrolase [Heyndrickxia oleronia]MBU5210513.1 amidohydrolase [Heyndrickxia oleronia]